MNNDTKKLSWIGDEVFDFRTFYYIYFVNPATGEKLQQLQGLLVGKTISKFEYNRLTIYTI